MIISHKPIIVSASLIKISKITRDLTRVSPELSRAVHASSDTADQRGVSREHTPHLMVNRCRRRGTPTYTIRIWFDVPHARHQEGTVNLGRVVASQGTEIGGRGRYRVIHEVLEKKNKCAVCIHCM